MNLNADVIEENIPEGIDWYSEPSTPEDVKEWFEYCQSMESKIEIQLDTINDKINDIQETLRDMKDKVEIMSNIKQLVIPFYILNKEYRLDIILEKEDDVYIALLPSLDIASQGDTVIDACENLKDAFELYFDGESKSFIGKKMGGIESVAK